MPTIERIRELCIRIGTAQGDEFELTILELANAIDTYNHVRDVDGNKAAKAEQA